MTLHILQRIETLAAFSEEPARLTRSAFPGGMRQANSEVSTSMREAGMRVYLDPLGNLIGHYPPEHPQTSAQARVFLFGSHLDTVRDAGKFEGTLGVLLALACVERLHQRHKKLPFAIEIIAFADEEGLRYHASYLGSRAVAGIFNLAECAQRRLGLAYESIHTSSATACSPRLRGLLARAVEECEQAVSYLPNGAGHDAVAMAHRTEIAMLCVRCQGGISHNPAESVQVEDIAVALDVLDHFLALLADIIGQADRSNTT